MNAKTCETPSAGDSANSYVHDMAYFYDVTYVHDVMYVRDVT